MKAKMKGVLGAIKPATQNQACMWSEPDLIGWLDKRGGKFKSWKKRFFILQGSYLFYFENDFKVQAKNPLGVIPLDASKVEMKSEESGDASRRYTFYICLGKQFIGYSKRDTYVVAAPSHQALLGKEAREKLRFKVEHALYLVQERQAKTRSKAPRYSFNLNPKVFDDEGESLQQEFELDTEGTQPAALKFYKNIRAEVLETAEQLKNLKNTALKVAGIEERGEESIDKLVSSEENESSYDGRMVTNSNMLTDMMKKKGGPGRDFLVEDTSGRQIVEGTTKAWIRDQQQEQRPGMQSQSTPAQPLTSWPEQTQLAGIRPSPQSFSQPQSQIPGVRLGPQSFSPLQSQMPLPQSQFPGARPLPASFVPPQSQPPRAMAPLEPYEPPTEGFPEPMLQYDPRLINQSVPMRPTNQPVGPAGPAFQSFLPRGFQQQMTSMRQPFTPNWSAQRPAAQPMTPTEGLGPPPQGLGTSMLPPGAMMLNRQQPGLSPPGAMMLNRQQPGLGAMMLNRQQPGLSPPARQISPIFAPPRMPMSPPLGTGRQQYMGPHPPQPFSPGGMASQMQQMPMPQQGTLPRMQTIMPQMASAQQNFPRPAPQMPPARLNFARPPPPQMASAQGNFTRPPQMASTQQNVSRPTPYDGGLPYSPQMT